MGLPEKLNAAKEELKSEIIDELIKRAAADAIAYHELQEQFNTLRSRVEQLEFKAAQSNTPTIRAVPKPVRNPTTS